MTPDPKQYELLISYLDKNASVEDRQMAMELLLASPEARAALLELAGQMVELIDYCNFSEETTNQLSPEPPPAQSIPKPTALPRLCQRTPPAEGPPISRASSCAGMWQPRCSCWPFCSWGRSHS